MDPKNIVRGALAQLRERSTPKASSDPWQRDLIAHQQINRAIEQARRLYTRSQFEAFERWVIHHISTHAPNFQKIGSPLTSLGTLPPEITAQSLTMEISLAAERLDRFSEGLTEFAYDISRISSSLLNNDLDSASYQLRRVIERDGFSYWAVETDLALTQMRHGVEPLKARIAQLVVKAPAWNRFFFYMFGWRNEPAQASGRFKSIVRKRLDNSSMSDSLKPYARFRLFGALEAESAALAQVLACECMTTPADLLVTVIKVLRFLLDHRESFSEQELQHARTALQKLDRISSKLGLQGSAEEVHTDQEHCIPGSWLLQIASAAIEATLSTQSRPALSENDRIIVEGISSLLSTRSDGVRAEELAKLTLNLGWLPRFIQLGDPAETPSLPQLLVEKDEEREDILSIRSALAEAVRRENTSGIELFSVLASLRDGNRHLAETDLNSIDRTDGQVRDLLDVALACGQLDQGLYPEFLSTCARSGVENDRLTGLLPLGSLFQGAKWGRLKGFAASADLAICLNLYLRSVDDRKMKTYKRYAVEELAKKFCSGQITALPTALLDSGEDMRKIEYFGYHVCDIATLELLPGMGDSRRVLRARSAILRAIEKLHTPKEITYRREADEIEYGLQVDDGLSVLEDSKVYVDAQAVLNHVNQELEADFHRYKNLFESGVGVSESIHDLLASFKSPTAKTFQIPKNDADDLLADLVETILYRFLSDPAAGLDIIVGRRIRHGTIAGELRGALEALELIGQRPRPGAAYEPSPFVRNNCQRLDPKRRKMAHAAFSRFSESIDQLVTLLRDEYFHVRTKSQEKGIFDVPMTPVMLALARSLAQSAHSIQEFSKECIQIFWYLLSVRLDAMRPTVENETKKTLQSVFGKLASELRALGVDGNLSARVQRSSEELQRRASTIASWIRAPKSAADNRYYAMGRVVGVAAAVVAGQRPGFRPKVIAKVPDGFALDTHGFSLVSDALYIAIDNVGQHSGIKVDNNVRVAIEPKVGEGLLSFEIVCDIAPGVRTPEKEARLAKIRSEIQRKRYAEHARRDRNSGLSKLAAIVMQSELTSSSLKFGFEDDQSFALTFDLVHIKIAETQQSSVDAASASDYALDMAEDY